MWRTPDCSLSRKRSGVAALGLRNSQANVFYGMHFVDGLAEYDKPKGDGRFRVFLNEDTLRKMDPSFAGRPVFVDHVDEVDGDLDDLRLKADGYVVESFLNSADSKHWVKFIVTSNAGLKAIKDGKRLSNCYEPTDMGESGVWNGIDYDHQILNGVYEHLALVDNPRYDESVIMTPEQFKAYNAKKLEELKRLSNSKNKKGGGVMGLRLFKKKKVDNAAELEGMHLVLPKSKIEISLIDLVSRADEAEVTKDKPRLVNAADMVKCNGDDGKPTEMTVGALVDRVRALAEELEAYKGGGVDDELENEDDEDDETEDMENEDDGGEVDHELENEDDGDDDADDMPPKKKKNKAKKKNDLSDAELRALRIKAIRLKNMADKKAKAKAKAKADLVRNAPKKVKNSDEDDVVLQGIELGKARYGA